MEVVIGIEEEFGIELPINPLETNTVGEFSAYVADKINRSDSQAVWNIVQRVVSESLGIPVSEIRPESRWIEDLNVE